MPYKFGRRRWNVLEKFRPLAPIKERGMRQGRREKNLLSLGLGEFVSLSHLPL
jgi:hypothetical protein